MGDYRLNLRGRRKTNLFGRLPAFVVVIVLLLVSPTDQAFAREAGTWKDVVPGALLGAYRHGTYPSWGKRTHVGIDLLAECGSPILAYQEGTVTDVIEAEGDKDFRSLGYMVIIEHPEHLTGRKFYSLYLHMAAPPSVRKGQPVAKGGRIGIVGTTGAANETCHTHFEIRYFRDRISTWGDSQKANIYGVGDKRNDAYFRQQWADPMVFFAAVNNSQVPLAGPSIGYVRTGKYYPGIANECGCKFELKGKGSRILWMEGRDDRVVFYSADYDPTTLPRAVMNIDGRNIVLTAPSNDLGVVRIYRRDEVSALVQMGPPFSVCSGENCEVEGYNATITVETKQGKTTVHAIGGCGC